MEGVDSDPQLPGPTRRPDNRGGTVLRPEAQGRVLLAPRTDAQSPSSCSKTTENGLGGPPCGWVALAQSKDTALQHALRMTWKGIHPVVRRLHGHYPEGVRLTKKEMKPYEARLQRSKTLPKYDITIEPSPAETQVK